MSIKREIKNIEKEINKAERNIGKSMKRTEKGIEKEIKHAEKDIVHAERWMHERRKFFIKLGFVIGLVVVLLIISHFYLRTSGVGI